MIYYDDIAIGSVLNDIAIESESVNKNPGRLRMMIANLCKRLYLRCKRNYSKSSSNNGKLANLWKSLADWFEKMYKRIANTSIQISDNELNTAKETVKQKASQVKATEEKSKNEETKKENTTQQQSQTKQETTNNVANKSNKDPKDFTYTDGDGVNGSPQKSRKRGNVVREYAAKANACKKNGDMKGYHHWAKLRDEAAMNPDLNSMIYYDPYLEFALENYLGYDLYRYTTLYDYNAIVSECLNSNNDLYLNDAIAYESIIANLELFNSNDESSLESLMI